MNELALCELGSLGSVKANTGCKYENLRARSCPVIKYPRSHSCEYLMRKLAISDGHSPVFLTSAAILLEVRAEKE